MFDSITFHTNPWFGHIATLVYISLVYISTLCESSMQPGVYILLFRQEGRGALFFLRDRCTHLAAHSSKRLNSLSVILLVCIAFNRPSSMPSNYTKTRLQDKLFRC